MTQDLAETMGTVKTNMTSGSGSQARYFTMWERESSGRINLAVKRKASEAAEGLVKKVARAEAGPFYLEDEDYGARYAPSRRAGGREATVAEEP
jgi:hypothetical protein